MPLELPVIDDLSRSRFVGAAALAGLAGTVALAPVPVGWGLPLLLASASGVALMAWRRWAGFPVLGDIPDEASNPYVRGGWTVARYFGRHGNLGLVPLGATPAGRPVWLPASAVTGPMLLVGPDAARDGVVLEIAAAALATGSGLVHVDDGRLPGRLDAIAALAHEAGRAEDVIVLDLCRAGLGGPSHRYNPLGTASPDTMQRLLRDVLTRERGALPAHWDGRAELLLLAVLGLVAFRRDDGGEPVSLNGIRKAMRFENLLKAVDHGTDYLLLDKAQRDAVEAYLSTLPGYDRLRGARQKAATLEDHASVMLALDAGMAFLAARLGGVLDGPASDVDMADVLANRRILVVRLPGGTADDAEARLLARYVLGGLLGEAAAYRERARRDHASPLFPVFLEGVEEIFGESLRDWTRPLDGLAMTVHSVPPASGAWDGAQGRQLLGLPCILLRGGGFGAAFAPAQGRPAPADCLFLGRRAIRLAPVAASRERPVSDMVLAPLVSLDMPTADFKETARYGAPAKDEPSKDGGEVYISDILADLIDDEGEGDDIDFGPPLRILQDLDLEIPRARRPRGTPGRRGTAE